MKRSSPEKLAYMRQYAAKNRERIRARNRAYYQRKREAFWSYQLKYHYGITAEQREELVQKQGGVCALCGSEGHDKGRKTKLYVDHCHDTGRIRGLLCHRCNLGLGALGDNEEGLKRALAYLRQCA